LYLYVYKFFTTIEPFMMNKKYFMSDLKEWSMNMRIVHGQILLPLKWFLF